MTKDGAGFDPVFDDGPEFFFQPPNGAPKWFYFPCQNRSPQSAGGFVGRCSVPIFPQRDGRGQSWSWDGNREQPTLTPSINCGSCGWHGRVTAGAQTNKPEPTNDD